MNYTELAKKIAVETKIPMKRARAILDLFVNDIRTELDLTGKAKMRDFGFFKAKLHKAREVRIPGKPEKKFKASHFSVHFHPDKKLLRKVSRSAG
jgi:nucleoid DNA-binding protein